MSKMPFDRVVFALFNELVSVYVLGEGHGVRSGRLCEQGAGTERAILSALYSSPLFPSKAGDDGRSPEMKI